MIFHGYVSPFTRPGRAILHGSASKLPAPEAVPRVRGAPAALLPSWLERLPGAAGRHGAPFPMVLRWAMGLAIPG